MTWGNGEAVGVGGGVSDGEEGGRERETARACRRSQAEEGAESVEEGGRERDLSGGLTVGRWVRKGTWIEEERQAENES